MRRRLLIIGLVALLCAGAAAVWTYRQRLFAPRDVSEAYLRYADRQDIEATYIKDYAVTDSMNVDVTLLRALDTASWIGLFGEYNFNLRNLQDIPEQYRHHYLFEGLTVRCFPKGHPELIADACSTDVEIAVINKNDWTVMVCHTESFEETRAIQRYQIYDYLKDYE